MFLALMDVRGRGEAALMSTSIAPQSMEGKDFTKKRDSFGHVGCSDADDRRLCVELLVNLASGGAHFAQILVVWSIKIADFGHIWPPAAREIVAIWRKAESMAIGCA